MWGPWGGVVVVAGAGADRWHPFAAFARNLGVVPVTVLPGWLIAMLAAGVVAAAPAIAVIPAVTAAGSRPGPVLRAE